jgi:hypothetical protein
MAEPLDIQTEYSNLLASFAKGSLSSDPYVATPPAEPQAPSVQDDPILEHTEVPVEPVAPATSEAPKAPEVPAVAVADQGDTTFNDWDAVETPTPSETVPAIPVEVYIELGKALGLEKDQSKETVLQAINTLKAEVEKSKLPDASQIPGELKKAIELAQKGGDYLEYLKVSTLDYSSADEIELYENYIIDSSADAEGKIDFDAVNDYLENMPKVEKELRAKEFKRQLINEQSRRVRDIEIAALREREKHDMELKAALSGFNEIDGFKIDDRHRREVFDWVSSGKIMKDLFYGPDGQLDANKIAKIAFRNKYFDKLDAYQKNKIRNSTKREIFADISNAQVNTPPVPSNPAPKKPYDADAYMRDLIENFGKNK